MRFLAISAFAAVVFAASPALAKKIAAPGYPTLAAAKTACGSDTVVWAAPYAKVYHLSGSRWFGKTKKGAYYCKAALDGSGLHASKE